MAFRNRGDPRKSKDHEEREDIFSKIAKDIAAIEAGETPPSELLLIQQEKERERAALAVEMDAAEKKGIGKKEKPKEDEKKDGAEPAVEEEPQTENEPPQLAKELKTHLKVTPPLAETFTLMVGSAGSGKSSLLQLLQSATTSKDDKPKPTVALEYM